MWLTQNNGSTKNVGFDTNMFAFIRINKNRINKFGDDSKILMRDYFKLKTVFKIFCGKIFTATPDIAQIPIIWVLIINILHLNNCILT